MEYRAKLNVDGYSMPDPFTLEDGWQDETHKSLWPSLYFIDISDYLRLKTPTELHNQLCNEYKLGKGYRYIF